MPVTQQTFEQSAMVEESLRAEARAQAAREDPSEVAKTLSRRLAEILSEKIAAATRPRVYSPPHKYSPAGEFGKRCAKCSYPKDHEVHVDEAAA